VETMAGRVASPWARWIDVAAEGCETKMIARGREKRRSPVFTDEARPESRADGDLHAARLFGRDETQTIALKRRLDRSIAPAAEVQRHFACFACL